METLDGFPYFEVQFTREGQVFEQREVDALFAGLAAEAPTDLLVFSHGWNNDIQEARELYRGWLRHLRAHLDAGTVPAVRDRRFAVLAVFWPSKKFTDRELIAGGAASVEDAAQAELAARLELLKGFFDHPEADARLDDAIRLVPRLENSEPAREEFGRLLASLAPPSSGGPQAEDVDAGDRLSGWSGDELIRELAEPPALAAAPGDGFEGGAAGLDDVGGAGGMDEFGGGAADGEGGAAGLGSMFGGLVDGARNLANLVTYYQMKNRAGTVGSLGVAPLLDAVGGRVPGLRVHLVGHSFGGRLVTATAAGAKRPVASMTLLQAAFSHYGFADDYHGTGKPGFFRGVVAGGKVSGPVVITHTRRDSAVGLAYALASRLAGQHAAAVGDENDMFGGIGSNGAQDTPERVEGALLAPGAAYAFQPGRLHNLKGDAFISGHSDVANPATTWAVLSAIATT
jgi:hypothetical protein